MQLVFLEGMFIFLRWALCYYIVLFHYTPMKSLDFLSSAFASLKMENTRTTLIKVILYCSIVRKRRFSSLVNYSQFTSLKTEKINGRKLLTNDTRSIAAGAAISSASTTATAALPTTTTSATAAVAATTATPTTTA